LIVSGVLDTTPTANKSTSKSDNRQSVGWFSERAADLGGSPVFVERLPSTFEGDELDEHKPASIPDVLVDEHPDSDSSLMADIDKSTGKPLAYAILQISFYLVYRARSLYVFEGEGQEDLSKYDNDHYDSS
jgi:hypothetical protein